LRCKTEDTQGVRILSALSFFYPTDRVEPDAAPRVRRAGFVALFVRFLDEAERALVSRFLWLAVVVFDVDAKRTVTPVFRVPLRMEIDP